MNDNKNIKLIADAGSTKIEWVALNSAGEVVCRHISEGLNALISDNETISRAFADVKKNLGENINPSQIFYYGAGCATPQICNKMNENLMATWPGAHAHAYSDLLAAARALLQDKKGIACILGTGSNSCLYDGYNIQENVPSLGFILGDEGGGAALGKRLVSDAFKGYLPSLVKERFLEQCNLSLAEILNKVYREPAPNKFLASLVPFIKENLWNPYVYSIVIKEFSHFLRRNVAMYEDCRRLPLCFTGSIAWHFSDLLKEAAETQGFTIAKITKGPMDGLIEFHNKFNSLNLEN